ncbi:LysR family transcriptional regulator [Lacibacterium aquatile]|uniref:LysR family transcriptional regulator n=1 Tax=Lacibacterium aquatile TaxID=1168082 RepID=A0ABW5E1W5_9PROT
MNLKHLQVFKAVMEAGSTIAAAGSLGLSQSAISRQLTALEEDIGFELFIRDKGRLLPRPEAQAFFREVDALMLSLTQVRLAAESLKNGATGEILVRMAFPHTMANTSLPGMVAEYLKDRPSVTLEILQGPYDAIERMVRSRVADFGFVRMPTEDQSLDFRPITVSGTLCVMPKGHPLAENQIIEIRDLARADLILLGRQRVNRTELEFELRRAGAGYRCRLEVHSVQTACACAAAGLGVAIIPKVFASAVSDLALEMRPMRPDRSYSYGIITLPDSPLSVAAEAFIDLISRKLASEG